MICAIRCLLCPGFSLSACSISNRSTSAFCGNNHRCFEEKRPQVCVCDCCKEGMITIEGYSGCGIRVFRNPEPNATDYILEKSTDSGAYVPRLLLQQKKQSQFTKFNKLPFIVVPKILYVRQELRTDFDLTTGDEITPAKPLRCAVGMNFIHHTDALSFLATATTNDVRRFSNAINAILLQNVNHSPVQTVDGTIFVEKLLDIQRLCQKNSNIPSGHRDFVCNVVIPSLIDSLLVSDGGDVSACTSLCIQGKQSFVKKLELPMGYCHGDLTLSNILVASQDDTMNAFAPPSSSAPGGSPMVTPTAFPSTVDATRIVLIDFLDSFVETPLADMAKLCQDLKYAWTIRVSSTGAALDTVQFFSILSFLFNEMDKTFSIYPWYQAYFSLMFVMNQLRVLQYSKDASAAEYLSMTVREEFKIFEEKKRI